LDYLDSPKVVEVLDVALCRKRLLAYGGLFASERKRLNCEKVEKIAVSELLDNPLIEKMFLSWSFGGSYRVTPY
jgi:hypothetical protein